MSIKHDTLFSELFNYYRQLQSRRWQYYATLLIVDGLLLNAWKDLSGARDRIILLSLCVGAIFIFIASFRLLSRVRYRIHVTGMLINRLSGRRVLDTGSLGWLSIRGNTIWLYLSVFVLSAPWFIGLWNLSRWTAGAMGLVYVFSLAFVRWTLPREADETHEQAKEAGDTEHKKGC